MQPQRQINHQHVNGDVQSRSSSSQAVKTSQLVVVKESSHMIMMEQPTEVARELLEHLCQVLEGMQGHIRN